MGFIKGVQGVLDGWDPDDKFCLICRNEFEANDIIVIPGCCHLQYHIECASKWLNMRYPPDTPNHLSAFATCMPCTARWHIGIFNSTFPPGRVTEYARLRVTEGHFLRLAAGVPPANSSLVEATKHYGRRGLAVLLSEIAGYRPESIREEEDVQPLIAAVIDEICLRFYNPNREEDVD
jgi:hypothetical protein